MVAKTNNEIQPSPNKPDPECPRMQGQKPEGMQRRTRHIVGPGYLLIQKKTWKKLALGITGAMAFSTLSMYVSSQYLEQRRKIESEIYDQGECGVSSCSQIIFVFECHAYINLHFLFSDSSKAFVGIQIEIQVLLPNKAIVIPSQTLPSHITMPKVKELPLLLQFIEYHVCNVSCPRQSFW
ncbi:hypothetical protein DFH05DRAFT_1500684 [Lentinula detonsa]|uniref:Uncharacterized protein n=1 Tax=Lentinula detonsa TaxID=2804962 RepID=A0A9W8TVP3_9AGAR|nr:hypothetical protein DFH05DRAFT_1500684 [Lentinula detonsa]